MSLDTVFELLSLLGNSTGMFPACNHGYIAPFHDRLDLVGGQSVVGSTILRRLDEIPACLWCVVLQIGAVHDGLIESGYVRCWR